MHVISKKKLREFSAKYSDSESALSAWNQVARKAKWQHINDVKSLYPSTDAVGNFLRTGQKANSRRELISMEFEVKEDTSKEV